MDQIEVEQLPVVEEDAERADYHQFRLNQERRRIERAKIRVSRPRRVRVSGKVIEGVSVALVDGLGQPVDRVPMIPMKIVRDADGAYSHAIDDRAIALAVQRLIRNNPEFAKVGVVNANAGAEETAIARWRKRCGLSQRRAAKALDMSLSAYQEQELGKSFTDGSPRRPSTALLLACAAWEMGIQPIE